jgi:hypothetical protein
MGKGTDLVIWKIKVQGVEEKDCPMTQRGGLIWSEIDEIQLLTEIL